MTPIQKRKLLSFLFLMTRNKPSSNGIYNQTTINSISIPKMIYGRGEDDTSSIKILVYKQTKEAMASPSRSFITRTPWVLRERDGISLSAVRMTWPFLEM